MFSLAAGGPNSDEASAESGHARDGSRLLSGQKRGEFLFLDALTVNHAFATQHVFVK